MDFLNIITIYNVVILLSILTTGICTFCVNSREGIDHIDYLESNSTCSRSLPHLLQSLKSKSSVSIILETNIILEDVVYIENFNGLVITSHEESIISCNISFSETGIYISSVTNFTLLDITIEKCGMLKESSTHNIENNEDRWMIWSSVYITNSTDIEIRNVTFTHNKGAGLIMLDTGGDVLIEKSTFESNKVMDKLCPGGGGAYIEFTDKIENSVYIINNSTFKNNNVSELKPKLGSLVYTYDTHQGIGRGGGLCIILRGDSRNNTITISNSRFINNTATTWGGGLYLLLRDTPRDNSILVYNTDFFENTCLYEGGGGAKITLLTNKYSNYISFHGCNFTSNRAEKNGGGIAYVARRENDTSHFEDRLNNTVLLVKCTWKNNTAGMASALDISPTLWDVFGHGILPIPILQDCTFESNYVTPTITIISEVGKIRQETRGVATLLVTNTEVKFRGSMIFRDNKQTAIYLQSGQVTLEDTRLILTNNTGKYGGAMAFYGFSMVYLYPQSFVNFSGNTAHIRGGAIYSHLIDQHEQFSSRSCFFRGKKDNPELQNVTIIFHNNIAYTNEGNSVYATSLYPCAQYCRANSSCRSLKALTCLGDIKGLKESDVTTEPHTFKYNYSNYQWVPGKYYSISIKAYDELNNTLNTLFKVSLKENNSVRLDSNSQVKPFISNTKIQLYSTEEENNTLIFERDGTTIYIDVSVIECPPGHRMEEDSGICVCDSSAIGIWKCNRSSKVAHIIGGYWIGLCGNREQCTGICPLGLCTNKRTIELDMRINDTAKLVCASNREGTLCGKCVANHSTYYHSNEYKCGDETLCVYGFLFYIVSEILPLTILFTFVVIFNISFTSGAANGFILYAQLLDFLNIDFYNIHLLPKQFTDTHRFFYSMSNLNFFSIDKLSFCLWKGASTLDIISWKYATIVYALFLILITVLLLNISICKKLCACWRPHTLKSAFIHGMTAFLVMCYSECARISIQLLRTTQLYGVKSELVVSFDGTILDKTPFKYSITPIAIISLVVVPPPLMLIAYPLCLRVLAVCRISELKIVNYLTSIVPMEFFDSFQSCYKDNFRFLSGAYFLYRVVPLIFLAVFNDRINAYISVEIFLVLILCIHAILQPYKKTQHNVMDTLLFTNLAVINAISLFNYQSITTGKVNVLPNMEKTLEVTGSIQLILIYLPLLYITIYATWFLIKCLTKKIKERKLTSTTAQNNQILIDSMQLPPLRGSFDDSQDEKYLLLLEINN